MFKETSQGVEIRVLVQPGAKKAQIVGPHNDRLKIKVRAPPLDGRANAEVMAVLSSHLDWPLKFIELLSGQKSRQKNILIRGMSATDATRKLQR